MNILEKIGNPIKKWFNDNTSIEIPTSDQNTAIIIGVLSGGMVKMVFKIFNQNKSKNLYWDLADEYFYIVKNRVETRDYKNIEKIRKVVFILKPNQDQYKKRLAHQKRIRAKFYSDSDVPKHRWAKLTDFSLIDLDFLDEKFGVISTDRGVQYIFDNKIRELGWMKDDYKKRALTISEIKEETEGNFLIDSNMFINYHNNDDVGRQIRHVFLIAANHKKMKFFVIPSVIDELYDHIDHMEGEKRKKKKFKMR